MSATTLRRVRAVIASVAGGMTVLVGCAAPSAAITATPGSVAAAHGAAAAHDAAAAGNASVQKVAAASHDANAAAVAPAAAPAAVAPAAAPATPTTSTAAETLAPGLYALDRLTSTISGTTAMIQARRSCPDVVDELRAGQWSLTSPKGDLNPLDVSMAMLSYGDKLAVMLLRGSDTSCSGIVTVSTPAEISAGGKLTAPKAVQELPVYCHVGPDLMADDPDNVVVVYGGVFFSDAGAFYLTVAGPATVGTHTLTMDDEGNSGVQLMEFHADSSVQDSALKLLGMYTGTDDGSDDSGAEGAYSYFQSMFAGGGTLTVTSTDPWQATITTTLTGGEAAAYDAADADDESDDATNPALNEKVTLTAPLHCDT